MAQAMEDRFIGNQGQRRQLEHRSVLRGLMLIAIVVMLVAIFASGAEKLFFQGWWRQW